jgi:hypothetical protein
MLFKAGNMSARAFESAALCVCACLFFGGVALAGGSASTATPMNGCDGNVMLVAQEKSQAMQDFRNAADNERISESGIPDSQLTGNCFNNLAYVGGDGTNGGGSLFSDDFSKKYTFTSSGGSWGTTTYYKDDIEHALSGFYPGYLNNAEGGVTGMMDYTQTQLSQQTTNGYQCQQTGSTAGYSTSTGLWDQQEQQGLTNLNPKTGKPMYDAPFWTFNNLTTGTVSNAGTAMTADLSQESSDFSNLNSDYSNLPQPATPLFTVNYTQGGDSVCDQLVTGGVAASGCP